MKNSRSRWLGTGIALCFATWALTQHGSGTSPAGDEPRAKCHLYLLIGQSNMAGRGTDILLGTPFIFNKDNIDQFDF